jgi:hypothetical protein
MSALLATLMFVTAACTPAQRAGFPVLSTVDAIGSGVAHVLGWCEDNELPPEAIAAAVKALTEKQYLAALAAVEPALTQAIRRGEVPTEVQASYQLARGMAAAYAVEQGMRALSGRNPEGAER